MWLLSSGKKTEGKKRDHVRFWRERERERERERREREDRERLSSLIFNFVFLYVCDRLINIAS